MINDLKVSILIPTLNAGMEWLNVLESVKMQTFGGIEKKIIVDSGSTDDTVPKAEQYGFEVIRINKNEFNHGSARQQLIEASINIDLCVFLTQDAVLTSPDSIPNLVSGFDNPGVGMAYGRQLPHPNAKSLETHARLFNYPPNSEILSLVDKERLGFKVFFCSNSFAAYRKSALDAVGGFPSNSIMGEDAIVAAKMLQKGYKKAYVAEATVYHSHNYTIKEEFKRYFDTRVFHEQNDWLIKEFGKPIGEGLKFVKSEIGYALKYDKMSLFKSFSSTLAKWLGYNLAKYYKNMPVRLLKKLSMHKFYWNTSKN
jgi:rhamnosyltransferase